MKNLVWMMGVLMLCAGTVRAENGDITITGTGTSYYGISITVPFGRKFNYNDIPVTLVLDGRTLKLADGAVVRLIGVEPVLGKGGKYSRLQARSAKEFTARLVSGRRVRLEFDERREDGQGRLLAYVFVKQTDVDAGAAGGALARGEEVPAVDTDQETELFVNAELIKAGQARFVSSPPNTRYDKLFE